MKMMKILIAVFCLWSMAVFAQTFPVNNLQVNGVSTFAGQSSFSLSPTGPTPPFGDSSTKLATTAFINSALNANAQCKNIMNYGGNNSGTSGGVANNAAWSAALAAQSGLLSPCVYFPPGNYLFNSGISYTIPTLGSSITVRGDGSSVTILTFPTATNGITLTTKDWTSSVHVRGLTLATKGQGNATGLALVQGAASISNEANTAQSDITDVTFMGSDGQNSGGPTSGVNYWANGVWVNAVSNINYISDMFLGALGAGTGSGTGVLLQGSSATLASVVHNFFGCNFIFNSISITMGTWVQGVSLTGVNLTEVNQGVVANGTSGMVQLAIANSQFSTYNSGVTVTGPLSNVSISNNLFYIGGTGAGVLVNNSGAAHFNITNNQFFPGFGPTNTFGVAVLASGTGADNLITGNVFNSLTTGIALNASAGLTWGIGANSLNGNTNNYSFGTSNYVFTNGANISGNSCGTGMAAATVYYLGMCQATTTESSAYMVASQPVTASRLQVHFTSAPGGGINTGVALRVNGATTALACTMSGVSQDCNDLVHTVAIPLGATYDIQIGTGAGAATTAASWSITLAP